MNPFIEVRSLARQFPRIPRLRPLVGAGPAVMGRIGDNPEVQTPAARTTLRPLAELPIERASDTPIPGAEPVMGYIDPQQEYKDRMEQFREQRENLIDNLANAERASQNPNDLDYGKSLGDITMGAETARANLHDALAANDLARREYEHMHPWGSPGNHPGFMGKFEHVMGRIGDVAGTAFAPGVMGMIPGTALNNQLRENRDVAQLEKGRAAAEHEQQIGVMGEEARAREEANRIAAEKLGMPTTAGIEDEEIRSYMQDHPGTTYGDAAVALKRAGANPLSGAKVYTDPATGKQFEGIPVEGQGIKDESTGRIVPNAQLFIPSQAPKNIVEEMQAKFPQYVAQLPPPADPAQYADWARKINQMAQEDQLNLAQARGAGYELNRPNQIMDRTGTHILGDWVPGLPPDLAKRFGGIEVGGRLAIPAPGVSREQLEAALGFGLGPKAPASMLNMGFMAATVVPEAKRVVGEINDISQSIGPLAGRWTDFMAGRVGTAVDKGKAASLQTDLHLLSAAIIRTHFGARGGAAESPLTKALDAHFSMAQSPENLIARIQSADSWMRGYAQAAGIELPEGNAASETGTVTMVGPDGKDYRVPQDKVQQALKDGLRRK